MALHTLTYLGTGAEHDVGSVPFSSELVWVGTGDITGTDELTVWPILLFSLTRAFTLPMALYTLTSLLPSIAMASE